MLPVMVLVLVAGVILGITFRRSKGSAAPVTTPVASRPSLAAAAPLSVAESSTNPKPLGNMADMAQSMNGARVDSDREARRQLDAYASRYSGEKVDAGWAGTTEAKLLAASKSEQITQLNAEPQQLDIDCKASMCRIQADFSNRSSADDWFTLFSMNGSDIPSTFFKYSINPDGSTRMTVYGLVRN